MRHLALVVFALLAAQFARGQGTAEDYARAASLRQLTENKVLNMVLTAHWANKAAEFWYRRDLPGGAREFVIVDAEQGKRRPAFNHERLAAGLARVTAQEVRADRLAIDELEFDEKELTLVLRGDHRRWRCDLQSYELHQQDGGPAGSVFLRPLEALQPSKRTGAETSLTFVNATAAVVKVYWIDADGDRQAYGSIPPGGQRQQHTFTGHIWLVTDAADKPLAFYEATAAAGTATVDASRTMPVQPPRPVQPPSPPSPEGFQSPDGKWLAFFKSSNVQLRQLESGAESSLSEDGTAEDEYSGRVWWSPDSRKLVVLRTRQGEDRKVYYVESSPKDQLQPKLHSYSYLKPGDRIPLARPQLFHVPEGDHVPVPHDLFPNPWSISEMRWDPDSKRFTFLYNQRGHQVLRVIAVDAVTGEARAMVDERSGTFIDYAGKAFLRHLTASPELIWMSERDGWNHLYLIDSGDGQLKNQITRGEWVVRGVDRIDEAARQIWFRAGGVRSGQDPYYVQHCRVNFDGTGLTILTEGDGTHSVTFSPDRRFFIDTWSRVDLPPVHELRRASDGGLVCELERADWSELLKTGWQAPERFAAKGRDGSTDIYGILIRPGHFDPNKQYPVIEDIYAGPHSAFVPKSFSPYYSMQGLAELGFIVVKIDGMGTSHRSKKFHDVCWKNLGDSGFPDRIAWLRAAAARYPSLDLSRVGIYGGSAGGQSSTRAVLAYGDFYRVAVSDCGCHDNRMDKVWWNELWMGWPIGPHYEEQSNVTQAHRLEGKLLLMVGEMDENVDPSSTMQLANALIKADKDFDLVLMTGKGHGSAETPYGRRRRADFFVRHLMGAEPRRSSGL